MNAVDRPRDPMQEFQDKLRSNVRDQIRDLLPEEAVSKLVEKAVEDTFFAPRKVDEGYGRVKEHPSWFIAEVTKAAEPILRKAVEDYVATNKEVVDKALADFLSREQLTILTTKQLTSMLGDLVMNLNNNLMNRR